ncbi:MAG: FkbM family methyltransferase [Chthoniobacteraceae bacterium]
MGIRHILRVLARSRSVRFSIDVAQARTRARAGVRGEPLAKLRWRGHDVFYRPATSDPLAIYQVLIRRRGKAEYYLPPALEPQVILDIGSNIGASILFFRKQFPAARIYGFEPHPETFRVLKKNVGSLPSVEIFNYGLSAADAKISVPFDGADFSRFMSKDETADWSGPLSPIACEVKHAGDVMKNLGLTRVDLIKIDCEGAEYEVLSSLPREMLSACKWIVGEMHDESAFPLLALLARHFDLDLKKGMFAPFFRFHACNLACVQQLKGTFDRNALQR